MSEFCDTFGLKSLIKDATCYRNPENTSSIDLILINNPYSFQNFCVIETSSLDFNKMVVTVMKTSFERLKPWVKKYRDYKSFKNKLIRKELLFELSNSTLEENADGLEEFIEMCQKALKHHVQVKQKFVLGNHSPFMDKTPSQAKMQRSRFLNKCLRNKTDENTRKYKKQQNYCVSSLKKLKREYYGNVDVKKITDKKNVFENFFLSGKVPSTPKITLIENDKNVRNYNEQQEL